MKVRKLFLLMIIFFIFSYNFAFSAMTQSAFDQDSRIKKITYTCTFGGGGAWTNADTRTIRGYVLYATTVPTGSPTANYDIVLNDSNGVDTMEGRMLNRSTSAAESTIYSPFPVVGPLTVVISNNSEANASVALTIYYVEMY